VAVLATPQVCDVVCSIEPPTFAGTPKLEKSTPALSEAFVCDPIEKLLHTLYYLSNTGQAF